MPKLAKSAFQNACSCSLGTFRKYSANAVFFANQVELCIQYNELVN